MIATGHRHYYYDTKLGTYQRSRTLDEIKAQRLYEYHLRAEARRTLARLRREGKRFSVYYSNSFSVSNRGLVVMPNPRLLPTGHLAWTVR